MKLSFFCTIGIESDEGESDRPVEFHDLFGPQPWSNKQRRPTVEDARQRDGERPETVRSTLEPAGIVVFGFLPAATACPLLRALGQHFNFPGTQTAPPVGPSRTRLSIASSAGWRQPFALRPCQFIVRSPRTRGHNGVLPMDAAGVPKFAEPVLHPDACYWTASRVRTSSNPSTRSWGAARTAATAKKWRAIVALLLAYFLSLEPSAGRRCECSNPGPLPRPSPTTPAARPTLGALH
jgi:hypothetical protein